MAVDRINGSLFTGLSAVDGRTLSTLTAINGQTIVGGGGGAMGNILPAQVLDWQPEESIADVGSNPDIIEIEVFS